MICIYIGEKLRTRYGNIKLRQLLFKEAQQEIKNNTMKSLEQDGYNWNQIKAYEQFFYPFLEKQYGLEKLQEPWNKLFKEKKSLTESIRQIYQKDISNIEKDFKSSILSAKNYKEFENI